MGYDGFLGYKQCSPIVLTGHRKGTLQEVDRRNQAGVAYMKKLMIDLGIYTGKKAQIQEMAARH
jgi:hypothetical protein